VQSHLEMAARRAGRGVDEAKPRTRHDESLECGIGAGSERDAWGGDFLDRLMQDLRFGVRMIASAGIRGGAILTLASGSGNTALFSYERSVAESAAVPRAGSNS